MSTIFPIHKQHFFNQVNYQHCMTMLVVHLSAVFIFATFVIHCNLLEGHLRAIVAIHTFTRHCEESSRGARLSTRQSMPLSCIARTMDCRAALAMTSPRDCPTSPRCARNDFCGDASHRAQGSHFKHSHAIHAFGAFHKRRKPKMDCHVEDSSQ